MSITRRAFLAGSLGLLAMLSTTESYAMPETNHFNAKYFISQTVTYNQDKSYERRKDDLRQKIRISYEEWKAAIENPKSREADVLRKKAKFLRDFPELANFMFEGEEERQEYIRFWKTSNFDIGKFNFDGISKEIKDIAILSTLELQVDIDRTYAPIKPGESRIRAFDYSNLNDGEKLIIFWHYMHERRYYAEGKKRDIRLFK